MNRCVGCGRIVSGGSDGCRATFDRLALPTPGGNPFLPWRRLLVDTYALQHPDPFCVSATSLAAHLTGVAWILEHPRDAANGNDQIRRWLNSRPALVKPRLPASFGDVRIDALVDADTPDAVARAVTRWAASTWEAYAPLHATARAAARHRARLDSPGARLSGPRAIAEEENWPLRNERHRWRFGGLATWRVGESETKAGRFRAALTDG
jgi:hypothetical protein